MDTQRHVFIFLVYLAIVTAACIDVALDPHPWLCWPGLAVASLMYQSKEQFTARLSPKGTIVVLIFIPLFVGFMMWGAISGANTASNEWFAHTQFRPVFALVFWLLYMYGGYGEFRKRLAGNVQSGAHSEGSRT